MKSTTLSALVLTLVMLLLVLLAAFYFTFQGQVKLQNSLAGAQQDISTLLQDVSVLEQKNNALENTATDMRFSQATAESINGKLNSDNEKLDRELVEVVKTIATQEAQTQALEQDHEVVSGRLKFYESAGPMVTIIEPQDSSVVSANEELTLEIVVSDLVGVREVVISDLRGEWTPIPVTPDQRIIVTREWTPQSAGLEIITVHADNNNGVSSRNITLELIVKEPTPTSTLTPTSTSTAEPSPESTPGSQ